MKEGIKEEILRVASEEFFKKGFNKASIRIIAKKMNISFSNIYYYYKSKEALFLEVVKPLKDILDENFSKWHKIDDSDISIDAFTDEKHQEESIKILMELTLKYKREFYLMLHNANGSALENIKKQYVENATRSGFAYVEKLKEKYPELNIKMSKLFMQTMNAYMFSIISEIVSQDLSKEEINQFMQDLVSFNTSGWKGLLHTNKKIKDEVLIY